jgi:hypothetical protein
MKRLLLSLLISALMCGSCIKDQNPSETANTTNTSDKRSFGYLKAKLKAGMALSDIKATFGEPDSDIAAAFMFMYINLKTQLKSG